METHIMGYTGFRVVGSIPGCGPSLIFEMQSYVRMPNLPVHAGFRNLGGKAFKLEACKPSTLLL